MSSRKKKNIVNAYLSKVDIKKKDNLKALLTEKYGEAAAKRLRGAFDTIEMKKGPDGDLTEMYDYIHSDYEFSMLMSCFSDGEIIRNTCAWLNSIRDQLGKTVLDVGCGNGIITCFLASILPGSTFMAIDRSENAIAIAKSLRNKLGLTNVVFAHQDLFLLKDERFDTVLSLRSADENCTAKDIRFLPFSNQLQSEEKAYASFIRKLSSLTGENGNLICMKREAGDSSSLAVLDLLRSSGMNLTGFQLFSCRVGDLKEQDLYSAFTVRRSSDEVSFQRLFTQWSSVIFAGAGNSGYQDVEADYMLEFCEAGKRKGYMTSDSVSGKQTGLFFICDYRERSDFFILYQKNAVSTRLGIYPISQKAEAEALLDADRQQDEDAGCKIQLLR